MNPAYNPKHDPLTDAQICIIWHPSGQSPAVALLRALDNKGMRLIDADDPHTAFAAACHAAQSARRTILVLEQRQHLREVDRICAALERFAPSVLCWAHEPSANPPLVPLVQPKDDKPSPQKTVAEQQTPTSSPTSLQTSPLRLVGLQEDKPAAEATSHEPQAAEPNISRRAPINARDVLDADELDALLSGEMGDRPN